MSALPTLLHHLVSALQPWMPHLLLAPVLLPLGAAAALLLLGEERQRPKLLLSLLATGAQAVLALVLLLWLVGAPSADATVRVAVYLPGNWPAPFGIVLALDRLSALMLLLATGVALACGLFAAARWHRAGVHFHPLFQFQLMGLAGAFLTADLFNLFVFFEIMLAASYGLLLHGSGQARVQAGLHYIAINLAASSLFLIGVSMLYGLTGTLNMADLALSVAQVDAADQGLLHAAAGILAMAFVIKAAAWPLNFWLVPAYAAASAPVGALFAVMTKVGVYSLLRLWTLCFGDDAGASAHWGWQGLVGLGAVTMVYGAIGMWGAQRLTHVAGFAAVLSSGTLLAAMGSGQASVTAGLLYYLPSSTLAVAALFLLADLIERWRNDGHSPKGGHDAPFLGADLRPTAGLNLDDDEGVLVGRVIPAATAFLGLAFVCATLVVAGLPPLSGFVGKLAMLHALLNPGPAAPPGLLAWSLLALMMATGLLALLALTRVGMRHFWGGHGRATPQLRVLEGLPIALLLAATMALSVGASPLLQYTTVTAQALHAPAGYVHAVMSAPPVPPPAVPQQPLPSTPSTPPLRGTP